MRAAAASGLSTLALLMGLLLPGTAAAHGGIVLASTTAGPFRVQIAGAPLTEPGKPPAIDVTVYVTDATSSTPVSGADVRTTVTADGRTVTPPVREIAGGYEAVVPVKDAYTVGKQTIAVTVRSPMGSGQVTVRPTADPGGPPVALLVGSGVVLVLLVLLAIRVRRRRDLATPLDDAWPEPTR